MKQENICHKISSPRCPKGNDRQRQRESAPNVARVVCSSLLLGALLSITAHAAGEEAQSNQVHYISIHDNNDGSIEANYDNDGATGRLAIAIGARTKAEHEYATALGFSTFATGWSSTALGHIAHAREMRSVAIGTFAQALHDDSVALGSNSNTQAPVATTSIEIAGKTYSFAGDHPQSTVSIGIDPLEDDGFTRTLVSLGAGRIAANSTDGVNGSQLFATNQALESLNGEVEALQTNVGSSSASGTAGVHFFSVGNPEFMPPNSAGNYNNDGAKGYASVAIGTNAEANTMHSIAIGRNSRADGDYSIAILGHTTLLNEAGIKIPGVDLAAGATSSVAIGGDTWQKNATALGYGSRVKHEGSVALGYDSTTEAVVATQGIDIAGNHYTFAGDNPSSTVSIGANHFERDNVYRTLTNVAAGRIGENSSDGVNGSQLFAFQQAIEELNGRVLNGASGSASPPSGGTGTSSTWTLTAGSTPARIGDSGTVAFHGDRNIAVTQTGADNHGEVNIALSRDLDLDRVSAGQTVLDRDGLRIQGGPSVTGNGIDGGDKVITNVAPGTLDAGSTDAVNGSQLFATNQKIDHVIAQGISGGGLGIVQYSDADTPTTPNGGKQTNDVTVVGADPERPVTIHNVAAGKNDTDAVNVAQMNAMGKGLNDRIDKVDERASRGAASSMASAGLPQAYLPGKSMIAAATAHYRGEQALAIGASTISDNGKWVLKGAVNANRKDAGVSLGLGYQW